MNIQKIYFFILFTFISFCSKAQNKAVLIILDGIPVDVLETVPTPALDDISKRGGYTHAYIGGEIGGVSESPTVSAVGYNHVITGTWSHKHNVYDNKIEAPNYNYWNMFRVAEKANKDLKTAVFSTWQDNRTKLIGEKLTEAGNIQLDYSFDGFELDTVKFPQKEKDYIHKIDEHVSKEAARYIEAEAPDLTWVYLQFTDDIGHYFGDSPQMVEAVKMADKQVERVWNAIKVREKSTGEKWMIVITTDHGRSETDGKGHGKHSERERKTWILTNNPDVNQRFKRLPAAVDIMPTLVRYLNITTPEEVSQEIDGVPLIGKISISDLKGKLNKKKLELQWEAFDPEGNVDFYISTKNEYQQGGADDYIKIGSAKIKDKKVTFNVPKMDSKFYKIVAKGPHNSTNTWIILE